MAPDVLQTLFRYYEWSELPETNGSTLRDVTVKAALRFDREFPNPHSSMDTAMSAVRGKTVAELLDGGWATNIAHTGRDLAHTLCNAAYFGYVNVVEIILENGVSPNAILPNGLFPLLLAADNGRAPVVYALLQKEGIEVNKTHEQSGIFPLLQAAQNGHAPVVDALLQREGIDVNRTDKQRGTFQLLQAAQNGHALVVDVLLQREDIDVNKTNKSGHFPLLLAAYNGSAPVVDALLQKEDIDVTAR